MSRTAHARKSASTATLLRPEEQGHPLIELHEGFVGGRKIATVSLKDRQTWIAGMNESQSNTHVGSFPSLDEAKYAVSGRLPPPMKPPMGARQSSGGEAGGEFPCHHQPHLVILALMSA